MIVHGLNLGRHFARSVVLSPSLVLLLLFVSLILLSTFSCAVALRWWHILSLIVHCPWSIAIHKGSLLIELLTSTSHLLLLHSWHVNLTWRHHRLKWSHIEHWICHERWLTWGIISVHLHLWLCGKWLLGVWTLPIFSRRGLWVRSATHRLVHLL